MEKIAENRVRELFEDKDVHEYDFETEIDFLRRIPIILDEGDVFWDVGGHVGMYSIVAEKLSSASEIFCFEASEITRNERLGPNLSNGDNIEVLPFALSDSNGKQEFLESGVGQSNNSLKFTSVEVDEYNLIEVKTHTAEKVVRSFNVPKPDVIKIDVEGAEHEVLQGFNDDLIDNLSAVIVEIHNIDTVDDCTIPFLENNGFRIKNKQIREHGSGNFTEQVELHSLD